MSRTQGVAASRRARRPGTARRVSRIARVGLPLGLALAAAALSSCGYTTRRLVEQPGVSTVAIAQFDNKTYRRDLEFRLTKILAEEVRARTPWRIASTSSADAVLTGTIHRADAIVLSERQDQARSPIVQRFEVVADCQLVERGTGRVLRQFAASGRQEFAPDRFGETLDGSATDGVLRTLAQSIVNGLERPIGDPNAIPPRDCKRAIPPRYSQTDPATRPPAPPNPCNPPK